MLERLGRIGHGPQRWLLIITGLLLCGLWWGWTPLFDVDETRYAEATREMLAGGDYLVPHYNALPRYQKPILYYWVQAVPMRLFGVQELSARLPSLACALLLVLAVHAFLLTWLPRLWPDRVRARGAALLGGVVLLLMPYTALWARLGVTDLLLTGCITASLLALLQTVLIRVTEAERAAAVRRARPWYLLAAVAAGLGMLAKGPVGIGLPALVWLAYHGCARTLRDEWRRVPWGPALGLLLLTVLPWYLAVAWREPAYLWQFFVVENLGRYTGVGQAGGRVLRDAADALAFLPAAMLLLFPASAPALYDLVARRPLPAPLGALRRFAWTWGLVVAGVFAVGRTHYANYPQSLAGAAALLAAVALLGRYAPGAEHPRAARAEGALLLAAGVAWMGLVPLAFVRGLYFPRPWAAALAPAALASVLLPLGAILAGYLFVLHRRRSHPARAFAWTLVLWGAYLLVLLYGMLPLTLRRSFGPVAMVGRDLAALHAGLPIVAYCPKPPEGLIFYARQPVRLLDARWTSPAACAQAIQHPTLLVTDAAGWRALHGPLHLRLLKQYAYFWVGVAEPNPAPALAPAPAQPISPTLPPLPSE
jgi:4-amino-4-deoxy-L-arabinose transferase-like glycosyltransferase